ncbi:SrfA family protein [Halomonas salifodinae]|uniref:SrfA family protein n=1 Tax=Halomonas salifodinae TaxID=438745 RepID=A0ABW2F0Q2_9GAMM
MSATLLHSGKIEHFRALGETGQPVYHSALQLRKVISRRLPGRERHLAIPQRDQQGEGVDWYSGISGEVIPWGSATEGEREDARIQLEAFRQEVIALNQAPPEGQGGDHEVFTRLVQWVCHFPDEAFIYLVDGTPVITFWGFIHPVADRHANPLLCLAPSMPPEVTRPTPSLASAPPVPPTPSEPEPAAPMQPWWRRWWWLLPLLLILALLLLGLRTCTSAGAPSLGAPSPGTGSPGATFPQSLWQGWDIWPFNQAGGGSVAVPGLAPAGLEGGPSTPTVVGISPTIAPPVLPSPDASLPDVPVPEAGLQAPNAEPATEMPAAPSLPEVSTPAEMPPPGDMPAPPSLPEGNASAEMPPEGGVPLPTTPGMAPTALEPLTLPPGAPDGKAEFLDGNWRGAGVMDSQTGRPLRVNYAFDQGEGVMYIQRGGSTGMTCAGPVSAVMHSGQLQMEARERARCEDGSYYEMPRVECRQPAGETAGCAASYDDEPFPMQLRKAS